MQTPLGVIINNAGVFVRLISDLRSNLRGQAAHILEAYFESIKMNRLYCRIQERGQRFQIQIEERGRKEGIRPIKRPAGITELAIKAEKIANAAQKASQAQAASPALIAELAIKAEEISDRMKGRQEAGPKTAPSSAAAAAAPNEPRRMINRAGG